MGADVFAAGAGGGAPRACACTGAGVARIAATNMTTEITELTEKTDLGVLGVFVESVLPPNSQSSPRSLVHKKSRRVRRARRLAYGPESACTCHERSRLLLYKAPIDGFDEVARRPRPRIRAVPARVSPGWRCGLDLVQVHACLDQIPNAVANDRHHVAVLHRIQLIAHSTVT